MEKYPISVCRVQPTIPYFTENGMPNTHQQQNSSNKTHIFIPNEHMIITDSQMFIICESDYLLYNLIVRMASCGVTQEEAAKAKKKKRNRKRKERAKRNKKKKEMFGTCGWWRLREDHPLQLIANEFAKEHGTPRFPLHVTYSYGNDEYNHEFNAQYADPPWFDPMDMKHIVWQPPDDRWEWYTVKEDGEFIVEFDFSRHEKENCLFHNIQIPVFLYDKCEMGPEPCLDGPEFYKYHISLAYAVVDMEEDWDDPYGLITSDDNYLQWFREALNNKKIILRNEDFTAELWNCSSKNVEEWNKL